MESKAPTFLPQHPHVYGMACRLGRLIFTLWQALFANAGSLLHSVGSLVKSILLPGMWYLFPESVGHRTFPSAIHPLTESRYGPRARLETIGVALPY